MFAIVKKDEKPMFLFSAGEQGFVTNQDLLSCNEVGEKVTKAIGGYLSDYNGHAVIVPTVKGGGDFTQIYNYFVQYFNSGNEKIKASLKNAIDNKNYPYSTEQVQLACQSLHNQLNNKIMRKITGVELINNTLTHEPDALQKFV